jgi:hypothetical protein
MTPRKYSQRLVDKIHLKKERGFSMKELERDFSLSHGQLKYILYTLKKYDTVQRPKNLPPGVGTISIAGLLPRAYCSNTMISMPRWKKIMTDIKSFFRWFFS